MWHHDRSMQALLLWGTEKDARVNIRIGVDIHSYNYDERRNVILIQSMIFGRSKEGKCTEWLYCCIFLGVFVCDMINRDVFTVHMKTIVNKVFFYCQRCSKLSNAGMASNSSASSWSFHCTRRFTTYDDIIRKARVILGKAFTVGPALHKSPLQ